MSNEQGTEGNVNALQNLETLGVSLVKRGANKKKFAYFKSHPSESTVKITEVLKTVLDEGTIDNPEKFKAIAKSAKLSEKGTAALEAIAKFRDAFGDEAGMKKALAMLVKADDDKEVEKDDVDNTKLSRKTKKGKDGEGDDQSAFEKAEGDDQGDDYDEGKDQDKKKKDDDEEDKMKSKKAIAKSLASVNEETRKMLEPILKEQEDRLDQLHAVVRKQSQVIKSQTDAQEEREWLTKCEKHVTHIPGKTPLALAKSLKKLADLDADMATERYEELKRSSDTIKKSAAFRDVGAGNTGASGSTAWDMINAKVDGLVEKSEGNMSREKATVKVMEMFPDLYAQSQEEQAERVRNRR